MVNHDLLQKEQQKSKSEEVILSSSENVFIKRRGEPALNTNLITLLPLG